MGKPGGQLPASQRRQRQNADADAEEVALLLLVIRWGRGLLHHITITQFQSNTVAFP